MNKIYSFKKEILFKNNIYEILSIAIDKKFSIEGYTIKGVFTINGEYLIRENEKDEFNIEIPYLNYIEDDYLLNKVNIDIDDFYYEIKDSNKLVINIDILVDGLEEKQDRDIIDNLVEEVEAKGELIDDPDEDNEERPNIVETQNNEYITYRVCIVREGDTLDSILTKYNISSDTLQKYNAINEIKTGDKLIIPYEKH